MLPDRRPRAGGQRRPRDLGRPRRSAPSSPCATTPSCRRSPASSTCVRGLTESLRSQNHEAANRLHTMVSLIEMGRAEEAVDFATEELAGRPAAHRPGGRRRRRPGARRAAAGQDRRGRRARHRADRSTGDVTGPTPARRAAATWSRWPATSSTTPSTRVAGTPASARSRSASTATDGRFADHRRRQRSRAARRGPRARPRARLVHQGRRQAAAGSGSPWSPRWRGATAARSTSAPRRTAARSSR